ncbi:hypothetical protein [Ectopseudomonas mendocina]|uniref:Uncharacterized protein n=1 Tax=Ectopseudomonas mendocina S5.2 TaxID=1225174 RepID=A0ABM5W2S0_ECTME|nr:hypothetical protein [Pseudomonas mendocina]ALN21529.1 hypothetical protein DW68_023690 [Pseudomonas mendocina S5.2]KES02145.1 hypothetical protein HN51_20375 [Pseudomonas mendocina]MDF2075654.1 hypothetical protein [Pseudomonas mendocina]
MKQGLDFLSILRRHFPVFIAAFFLALFSMAISQIVLLEVYPPSLDDYGIYMMLGSCGISLYLCAANLLVIRGRPRAVWLIVAAMVVCMLVIITHWGRRAPDLLYSIGLLLSLSTLLTLNSKCYRAMLAAMVEVRGQRAAWRKRFK